MLHDEATAKRTSEEKGVEKGIEIGRVEERRITMEKMRRKGYTEQQILELFGEDI